MTTQAKPRTYSAVCTAVNRNQKNSGWALQLAARPNLSFPDTFYVQDKEAIAAQVEGLKPGDYVTLTLSQGNLKSGKTGEYGPWDYWENIIAVEVGEQPAAPSVGRDGRGSQPPGSIDQRIAWNSAINNATNLIAASLALPAGERDELIHFPAQIEQGILGWAAWYYAAIVAGPPVQDEAPLDYGPGLGRPTGHSVPAAAPGSLRSAPGADATAPDGDDVDSLPWDPPEAPESAPAPPVARPPTKWTPTALWQRIQDGALRTWNEDVDMAVLESATPRGKKMPLPFVQSWAKGRVIFLPR